jgi:hypothetical protein
LIFDGREPPTETAVKLVESGMNQRATAKVFGVDEKQIRLDLEKMRGDSAENAERLRTEGRGQGIAGR